MRTFSHNAQLQSALKTFRQNGQSIAFVPTMGNLHEGHLDLVRKARQLCDIVVVSIFVNPLQFGANEDLDAYPRTMAADKEKLFAEGTNVLYAPAVEEIYPHGMEAQTIVHVPDLGDTLCGSSRPGHFDGVTTVVSKLFNIVQPDVAVFGEKDFQQLSIVRKMVTDLCMPIEIVGVATGRAEDGLALSSRNGYLTQEQRRIAPLLHQILGDCRDAIACDFDNFLQLESHARMKLLEAGFTPDYFAVRDARTLQAVTEQTEEIAILAAARLGNTRLIDNVRLSLNPVTDWGMLADGRQ
ncbi:MAG: pantoate--beta-alanine ligase [Halioglobus sp.]|nr:pantoate--beta-alanine ligase [Halioglobus sp.]